MTDNSDAELVEAARGGDKGSFSELCQRHYASVVGIAYSVLSDHHRAEDVAQETFAVVCRDFGRLEDPARFANWVTVICRNLARSAAGQRGRSVLLEDVRAQETDARDCGMEEAVWECVDRLPESEREVLVLRYFSGLTCEQVAGTLGISLHAVYGRLKRAKRRMSECLGRRGLGKSET